MKLIARAPIDHADGGGRDRRPGDTFELDDEDAGRALADSGRCDLVGPTAKAKPAAKGKDATD